MWTVCFVSAIPFSVTDFSVKHVWGVTCLCELCGFSIFTQQKILLQQRWQRKDVVLAQEALPKYVAMKSQPGLDLSGSGGGLVEEIVVAGLKLLRRMC